MGSLPELTPRQAQAAVERAGASMALTSGAGCGKTLVLARRYATLLLTGPGGEADPFDGLVALTFTDKAAVEMLQRVRAVLLDRLARLEDPRQRERLAHWVTELPAARVSTIHSFCAALLRRYAIEAGVDPNFAVCADQLVAAQMLEASVQAAVLAAVERQEPDVLELLARTDLDRVIREVRGLLERRIDWMDQDYSDPKATLARWRELQRQVRLCRLRALAAWEVAGRAGVPLCLPLYRAGRQAGRLPPGEARRHPEDARPSRRGGDGRGRGLPEGQTRQQGQGGGLGWQGRHACLPAKTRCLPGTVRRAGGVVRRVRAVGYGGCGVSGDADQAGPPG
ncbi:MAG: hypothetical protein B1H04_06840 [Planctomycetales bacterium 4484_123]|nr:MAG: hypothetical protein B1H04_06840 [Planctomycetales bacterium 4484_123]